MYGKAVMALVIFIALLVTYMILIGTFDFRSHFAPFLLSQPTTPTRCRSLSPLKVYMYDLPRRFNVGMLQRRSSDETPVTAETLPPWPYKSGLKKQHSVEYWILASLLHSGGDGDDREAVRVSDPEIADAFFVPFFSSLSFNTHGHNMTDPETEIDKQLQIDLVNFLRKSKYWQRSKGRDHVIPMQHPNAFRFLREQVNASILIVVDFGRYPKRVSNLRKDVVAPYVHVVDSYTDDETQSPFESRTTLIFFRGRKIRKDEGIIRAKLAKILSGYDDVLYENSVASEEGIKLSSQGMHSSKFCLHPAGDTPSSCRLFDAIVSHCVPVIVSDHIELPYEDEIDYSQFSIFFSVKEAVKPGFMVEKLRQVPKERWVEMWRWLKAVSHHFEFQDPPKKGDAVNMLWRQVRHKLPAVNLDVHRSTRLKVPDWWGRRR
ncbi:hypothetical protein Nepgr_003340 [Nepenthes gracilis]|uniref:Exostosin GT47 domain-containing protein n=1 Tax=Nepenthes gracilis TaxID=150966 RepID=A0AAD3XDR2_NEPGR|nr:hypothetical protein Nepgr_003340 [Nepenthes gracilis]